jgi:hypothetical protein
LGYPQTSRWKTACWVRLNHWDDEAGPLRRSGELSRLARTLIVLVSTSST